MHDTTTFSRFPRCKFLTLLLAIASGFITPAVHGAVVGENGGIVLDMGGVGTRALVLDENGNPILAEYDPNDGDFVKLVGDVVPAGQEPIFMSGMMYRGLLQAFESYRAEHDDDVAAGALVLTVEDYRARFPDGPTPSSLAKTLLVRNPERVSYSLLARDPILFEAPIELRSGSRGVPVDGNTLSLILNDAGQVLYASPNRIGYRSAYYQPRDGSLGDPERDDNFYRRFGEDLRGPMMGVRVESGLNPRFIAVTDEKGQFYLHSYIPPCPYVEIMHEYSLQAFVPYATFNPQAPNPRPEMVFRSVETSHYCFGLAAGLRSSGNLLGLMTAINIDAIIATSATPLVNINIPVDVALVQAKGALAAGNGEPIPIGDKTRYDAATAGDIEYRAPEQLDLDGNDSDDWIGAPVGSNGNEGVLYPDDHEHAGQAMVVLGGQPACFIDGLPYLDCQQENGEPVASPMAHLYRQGEPVADFEHRGLLTQISEDDLKDTDLYVFRTATGSLILKREGLETRDIDASAGGFALDIIIPGAAGAFANQAHRDGGLEAWQTSLGLEDEFIGRANDIDSLRPGESVTLVALNRPTGYLGIVHGVLGAGLEAQMTNGTGMLSVRFENLLLQPPNLAISAKRTRRDDEEFQIGFEGAALTDDTLIQVTTEWTGPNGEVIPSDIDGYTGRLARIIEPNVLAPERIAGNDVGTFNIEPGVHQQILKFEGDITGPEHFYLHVSGESQYNASDFSACTDCTGVLKYRPETYVPVKVAIPDIEKTHEIQRDDPDAPGAYQWAYRPEMQFSAFELEQIELRENHADNAVNLIDLTDPDTDLVLNLLETLSLDLLYQLVPPENDPLQTYGPEREFVFSLAGYEFTAEVGDQGELTFSNLDFLGSLSSEDFLTLQLLQGSDSTNVLFEYVFWMKPVGYPETAVVSVDDPTLPIVFQLPYYSQGDSQSSKEIVLDWKTNNGCSLEEATTSSSAGVFPNKLTTSRVANVDCIVTVQVRESDDYRVLEGSEATLGPIQTIAGAPAEVVLESPDSSLPADNTTTTNLSLTAKDAYGNFVQDGTTVAWTLEDDGELQNASAVTSGGRAEATLVAGSKVGDGVVNVLVGAKTASLTISKTQLSLSLSATANEVRAGSGETVTLTLAVDGEVANGAPVEWLSTRGDIQGQGEIVDGVATAQLSAADVPGEGIVIANVAGSNTEYRIGHIATGAVQGTLAHAAIVAAPSDGSVSVETLTGSASHAYISGTTLTLTGTPGTTAQVAAGGFFTPNARANLHLGMDDIENPAGDAPPVTYDLVSGRQATVFGGVAVDAAESFTRPGSSLKFDNGHVTIEGDSALDVDDGLFLNVRFRRAAENNTGLSTELLASKSNGTESAFALSLVENGQYLEASITTTTGVYRVRAQTPVEPEEWYIAGLRLRDGRLELALNDERRSLPYAGEMLADGGDISFGYGFAGHIDEIKYGEEAASSALVTIADGKMSAAVTFDATGHAYVPIRSTGRAAGIGQRVGFSVFPSGDFAQNATPTEVPVETKITDYALGMIGLGIAYASEEAGSQEQGLAVADEESWGAVAEWVGNRFFGQAWDYIKTTAEFVFQLTSAADVVTLVKAVIYMARGDYEDIDIFEVTFAAISVGVTVVGLITTGGAAVVALKPALLSLKGVLRLVARDIGLDALAKVGTITAKGAFNALRKFVDNPKAAIGELGDIAKALFAVVRDTSGATIRVFVGTVRSLRSFDEFVKLFKAPPGCLAYNGPEIFNERYANSVTRPSRWVQYALASALAFAIPTAHAADLCGLPTDQALKEFNEIAATGKFGARANEIREAVMQATNTLRLAPGGGKALTSTRSIEVLADLKYHGVKIEEFAEKAATGWGGKMRASGEQLDTLLKAFGDIPTNVQDYDKFVKLLGSGTENQVRGLYGEALAIKAIMNNLNLDPSKIRLGDRLPNDDPSIPKKLRGQLGVDGVFDTKDGKILLESKVRASFEVPEATFKQLETQFKKHLDYNIRPLLDREGKFSKGVPRLFYDMRGSFWETHGDEAFKRLKKILDDDPAYEYLKDAGFTFERNKDFHIISGASHPFIN